MCLIGLHLNDHPTYKLIIAANRDEAFSRPTAQATFWNDHPNILAGRDLMQHGTWLGITKTGRFAALTNYRKLEDHDSEKASRGEIVSNFLIGTDHGEHYLQLLKNEHDKYNGFNTIVGTIDELYYYGNYHSDIIKLEDGTHGLSNHLLNTPWPKVTQIKSLLNEYAIQNKQLNPNNLFNILNQTDIAQDKDLPETGIGLTLERQLSPIFIEIENYGTRCSTVILVTHDNKVDFYEKTYNSELTQKDVQFSFQIE